MFFSNTYQFSNVSFKSYSDLKFREIFSELCDIINLTRPSPKENSFKYLDGEPKELVTSCIYLQLENYYQEDNVLLQKRYEDPCRIMSEYRKLIKLCLKLKANDSERFKKFHAFLVKLKSTIIYSGNSWYDITELIRLLHSKLPIYLQDRWNRKALKIRMTKGYEAKLTNFMDLLEPDVYLVSDPLYFREVTFKMPCSLDKDKDKRFKNGKKLSLILCSAAPVCPLCSSMHDLI